MSKNRLFIICSLIAVLVWRAAGAAAGVGGVIVGLTDDPMAVGGGARPLGMGRAFAAVADDVDTMFINPAGLASLRGPQGMTMYTNLINEIYYSEFCAGLPAAFGTVGLGYVITGVNQIPITVDTKTVYADYYDTMLVFSYASVLARFFDYGKDIFVGMNLKLLNRGYNGGYNQSATGVSADIGCKYVYTPYLSFAVNRQSILPPSLG
ncbi:MAG TPA: hypothetical protein VMT55_04380, partial [Candidatus Sulfotelmatobacter sp.]|nr:hypothetical protein [Candidatus Sulfotelmatobacter sp.]